MYGTALRRSTGALARVSHAWISLARWALLAFTGGTVLSAVLQRHVLESEQGGRVQRFVDLNLGELFGMAAVVSLVFARRRARPLARADLAVLVACAMTWLLPETRLLPEPRAVYVGMTLAGAWLLARRSADRQLRDVAQVWLALSLCELWSKLAFKLAYGVVGPVEVELMQGVGQLFFPDLRSDGLSLSARPDWSIVIMEGCSAFHNLSLAALIWLCVLKIAGQRANLGALGALVISGALVVAFNVARILFMLPSYDAYHLWHDKQGSHAVSLASALAAVAPIVVHVGRRQPRPLGRGR